MGKCDPNLIGGKIWILTSSISPSKYPALSAQPVNPMNMELLGWSINPKINNIVYLLNNQYITCESERKNTTHLY